METILSWKLLQFLGNFIIVVCTTERIINIPQTIWQNSFGVGSDNLQDSGIYQRHLILNNGKVIRSNILKL